MGLYQGGIGLHVKVDHGGCYLSMAEQFFQGYNIESQFQKMGCIRVSQGMKAQILVMEVFLRFSTHYL